MLEGGLMKNRILVIEDNVEMQELLRVLLEQEEYSMLSATTAADALTILRTDPKLILILLDLSIPDMKTDALLSKMKEEGLAQHVPILYFSASPELQNMHLPEEVVGVIEKPFRVQHFLDMIATHRMPEYFEEYAPMSFLNDSRCRLYL